MQYLFLVLAGRKVIPPGDYFLQQVFHRLLFEADTDGVFVFVVSTLRSHCFRGEAGSGFRVHLFNLDADLLVAGDLGNGIQVVGIGQDVYSSFSADSSLKRMRMGSSFS